MAKQKKKAVVLRDQFEPLNKKQAAVQRTFKSKHQILIGSSGTGKTYTALRLALEQLIIPGSGIDQLIIIRSSVPTRDVGFLKGSLEEKIAVYEEPYSAIINSIAVPLSTAEREVHDSVYDKMKAHGQIKFVSTSYLRGLTFDNAIVLMDEAQSATFHELDTLVTRCGLDSKLIISGDYKQNDLKKGQSGLHDLMKIFDNMGNHFHVVEFTPEDCVRSEFVKEYLIAKEKLDL
jgi:phosphate starvation-inducible PhoH-like protein